MRSTRSFRFFAALLVLTSALAMSHPAAADEPVKVKLATLVPEGSLWHQLLLEMAFAWGTKAIFFALDWKKALVLVLVPHLWAVWGITSVNYLQHDGCDVTHPVNHSRNFMGRVFNWFTFNNGFHGIHHDQPGLHWSLARAAHMERHHPTIHPALEQSSLLVYLFEAFVWPGKRLNFDGTPVVLPEEGPDENWIPEKIPGADLGAEGVIETEEHAGAVATVSG